MDEFREVKKLLFRHVSHHFAVIEEKYWFLMFKIKQI